MSQEPTEHIKSYALYMPLELPENQLTLPQVYKKQKMIFSFPEPQNEILSPTLPNN